MKKFSSIIALVVAIIPLIANASHLKDRFQTAQSGDFIVCELNHSHNLVRVHENQGDTLLLEEITFPETLQKHGKAEWESWLNSGAEGHTSWIILEIDLKESRILECFSFFRNAWLALSENDSFLLKLLNLDLQPIPNSKRRKIGQAPREGIDTRKLWTPPLVFDGKKVAKPDFEAYEITWPKDESPLAAKRLEFYFDKSHPEFPFPYWGRVSNAAEAAYKFRVIDSGKGLASPTKELPRRAISFSKPPILKEDGLFVTLSAPPYYKGIELYALDSTLLEPMPITLPFTSECVNETLTCRVDPNTLSQKLSNKKEYRLLVSCKEPYDVTLEAKKTVFFEDLEIKK